MCELSKKAKAFLVDALLGEPKLQKQVADADIHNTVSLNGLDIQQSLKEKSKITAELGYKDLWRRFHQLETEMIITKPGRRMFPVIKVHLNGLEPDISYIVFLDIVPVDNKRYRYIYHSSQWKMAGEGDLVREPCVYIHPDSPATGQYWMAQDGVSFHKLKLSNNKNTKLSNQLSLHSMQKYIPRVHVLPISGSSLPVCNEDVFARASTFSFTETEFISVTAYHNQKITQLKIANNPFAKGLRSSSKDRKQEVQPLKQMSTQGISSTLNHYNRVSAFQKFEPKIKETKPVVLDNKTITHTHRHIPCETLVVDQKPIVYPLFINV